LADAEGFLAIIRSLEFIGQQLSGQIAGFWDYRPALVRLAGKSLLASEVPEALPVWHASFCSLYDEMRHARNDAVHQGSYARTLTNHALDLAIILEDALMSEASVVSQFMVREVVVAEQWYPISYVRQLMLKYAFSYLPSFDGIEWRLVPEWAVAQFIRGAASIDEKKKRLLTQVGEASRSQLRTIETVPIVANTLVSEALKKIEDHPLLIVDEKDHTRLVGLLTASDVL